MARVSATDVQLAWRFSLLPTSNFFFDPHSLLYHISLTSIHASHTTANMDDRANYTPAMIRMWRVFRTTKEMCLDRVRRAPGAFTSSH